MKIVENFWYPILDVFDFPRGKKKILRLTRFNQKLILWRDSTTNTLSCMVDRCPHKGVPLGKGRIVDGTIQCAYHGMRFDSKGKCVDVPAMGGRSAKIPKGFCASVYPVREQHGFIWLWWGKEQPTATIPFFRELENESHLKALSLHYPASFYRLMESNFDSYHIDHLHKGVFPTIGPVIHDFDCTVSGHLIKTTTRFKKNVESPPRKTLVNSILFPNLAMAEAVEMKMKNIIACAPIDDNFSWFMIRFYGKAFNVPVIGKVLNTINNFYGRTLIAPKDFVVQSEQEPKDIGWRSDQLIVPADRGIHEYWRLLRSELGEIQTPKNTSSRREHVELHTPRSP